MSDVYKCIKCDKKLFKMNGGFKCENNHIYELLENYNIPVFDFNESTCEYTIEEVGIRYDNSMKWVLDTFKISNSELRENLISRLNINGNDKVLVTGVGLGDDLIYIAKKVGKGGQIYAQDFSKQMISEAQKRVNRDEVLKNYDIIFSVSDATKLPFKNSMFDAVYHFGGINLFPSIKNGIHEMDRVVKDGGKVVFGDESIPPWLKNTEYGKMIINNNPICDFDLPLVHLPKNARNVAVTWEANYYFYVIEYIASSKEFDVDFDIPHKGLRGGTMRTRYYGQLEGISPSLRDEIYKIAEKKGISRKQMLEKLLRKGVEYV